MNVREELRALLNWKPASVRAGSDLRPDAKSGEHRQDPPEPSAASAVAPGVVKLPDNRWIGELLPSRPDYLVYVGIDFGTSGTKVVFRDLLAKESEQAPFALDFGTTLRGYSRFSYPSSIAVEGGEILLGHEAEAAPRPAVVLRSAKMFLLGRHPRRHEAFERSLAAACEGRPVSESPYEFATTLLVADVIRRTRNELFLAYPGIDIDSQVNWSIDVPVDHTEPDEMREPFRRVLDGALAASSWVRPRMRLTEITRDWPGVTTAIANAAGVAEDERRTHVVPEAVAILEGVRGFAPAGWDLNYGVVDIGAGTTDVGIFRVTPLRGNPWMPFFAASTLTVGCDDVDRALCDRLKVQGSSNDVLRGLVREAKTQLDRGAVTQFTFGDDLLQITKDELAAASATVEPAMREQMLRCFADAYSKDKDVGQWRALSIVVVGGGAMIEPLYNVFGRNLPVKEWCSVTLVALDDVFGNVGFAVVGASSVPPSRSDLTFLVPALGLTVPEPLRRDYGPPSTVGVAAGPREPSGDWTFRAEDMYD
jgi:hypothetical protein